MNDNKHRPYKPNFRHEGSRFDNRKSMGNAPFGSQHVAINRQIQVQHLCMWLPTNDAIKQEIVSMCKAPNNPNSASNPNVAELKLRLAAAKSRMDPIYASSNPVVVSSWRKFSNAVDIYRDLKTKINAPYVSNAWLKYWELYCYHNVAQYLDTTFPGVRHDAFFNAELPGAALAAAVHYFAANDHQFDWLASSIVPDEVTTNQSALGDQYGFYEMNKDKWLMDMTRAGSSGASSYSNNGDATVLANLNDFVAKIAASQHSIMLYSHDAGIDVGSIDSDGKLGFNDQELANAKIHLGCAMAGFMTLQKGGIFIAKQYTSFERFTSDLIAIYSVMFKQFAISKPLTSRAANSEIYLIGIGFLGYDETIKDALEHRLTHFNVNGFLSESTILEPLHDEIARAGRIIHGQQTVIINENLDLWDKYSAAGNIGAVDRGLATCKSRQIDEWLKLYPVPNVRRELLLKGK